MPEEETLRRAHEDAEEGKSPSTQAGEFVREEIHHVREGKHGARNAKQAIAIGLSKARRAGVKLPAPKGAETLLPLTIGPAIQGPLAAAVKRSHRRSVHARPMRRWIANVIQLRVRARFRVRLIRAL